MDRSQEILIEQLENLLDKVAPKEADFATMYVAEPKRFQQRTASEATFGIPGAGFVEFVGPLLLHFVVVIAMDIMEAVRKKAAEAAVTATWKFLSSKAMRGVDPKTKSQAETIATIIAALEDAGWNASEARAAAELVWECGTETARKLSKELG